MTENKRYSFNWKNGHPNFWDNHCDLADCYLTCEDVVDRLNELHDENQLLHKINEDAIDFMYDNFDLNIIFTDRELNNICSEMGWELSEKRIKSNQLEKENEKLKMFLKAVNEELDLANRDCDILEEENEQLKQRIKVLEDTVDGLTGTLAHLDLEEMM